MGSILYYFPDGNHPMARSSARLRDWLFSGPGKRRLLEVLLIEHPGRQWKRIELAKAAGQHPKARMDLYLGPLLQAEIVKRRGFVYSVEENHPLVEPLRTLLVGLGELPDTGLK